MAIRVKGNKMSVGRILGHDISRIRYKGKDIFTKKTQMKYIIRFIYNDTSGSMPINIQKYSVKDNKLLVNMTGGCYDSTNGYNDGLIRLNWGNLRQYRWTFTPLVNGTTTVNGAYNYGYDYGGSANQIVPYTADKDCVITFVTTGEY